MPAIATWIRQCDEHWFSAIFGRYPHLAVHNARTNPVELDKIDALLLTGGEALVTAQLYGLSGVNYDVRKQVWLARVSGEDKVAVVGPPSPYRTVADMQKSEKAALWAGSGKADNNTDFAAIMCHALGAKCKMTCSWPLLSLWSLRWC